MNNMDRMIASMPAKPAYLSLEEIIRRILATGKQAAGIFYLYFFIRDLAKSRRSREVEVGTDYLIETYKIGVSEKPIDRHKRQLIALGIVRKCHSWKNDGYLELLEDLDFRSAEKTEGGSADLTEQDSTKAGGSVKSADKEEDNMNTRDTDIVLSLSKNNISTILGKTFPDSQEPDGNQNPTEQKDSPSSSESSSASGSAGSFSACLDSTVIP